MGLIFGPPGAAMSPTHTRKGNRLYRYLSRRSGGCRRLLRGRRRPAVGRRAQSRRWIPRSVRFDSVEHKRKWRPYPQADGAETGIFGAPAVLPKKRLSNYRNRLSFQGVSRFQLSKKRDGAREKTRTSTTVKSLAPEASASTIPPPGQVWRGHIRAGVAVSTGRRRLSRLRGHVTGTGESRVCSIRRERQPPCPEQTAARSVYRVATLRSCGDGLASARVPLVPAGRSPYP